jgi:hypothetical protein
VDGITRITIGAITTHIITVVITTDTATTAVTIYTEPGFQGLVGIIDIGNRMWRRQRFVAPATSTKPIFASRLRAGDRHFNESLQIRQVFQPSGQEFEALRIYEGVLTSPYIRGRSYGAGNFHVMHRANNTLDQSV